MSTPNACYLVVALWDYSNRPEVWFEGVFETAEAARAAWDDFEQNVGGGKFITLLRIDLIGSTVDPLFDATVDFAQ